MAHLIDKSALVAEIGRRIESCAKQREDMLNVQCHALADDASARMGELQCIQDFLDTLEVKEVDLDKAIDDYIYTHDGRKRLALELDWKYCNLILKGGNEIIKFAKHFFVLGLKARTDKELVEEIYSHIDSIKDTADRMTSGNFMHNKAAIKFSANTIAKVLELIGLKAQKGEEV